ncbi:MAG: GNAT family N-acetyltransferase [Gaiellaceae bacterium]
MAVHIRLLGPGDEAVLALLAAEDPDFDVPGGSVPREPTPEPAAYLADPGVLHWVAEEDGRVVGFLLAYVQRRRAGDATQLMLYEIGVREAFRRRGVGRLLVGAMREWMEAHGVRTAWVLATPEAEAFYVACGFTPDVVPVQMTLSLS